MCSLWRGGVEMGIVYYFLYYRAGLVGVVRRISDRKFILEKKCFDTKRYCISDYRHCFSGGDTILLQETEGFEKGQIMQYL